MLYGKYSIVAKILTNRFFSKAQDLEVIIITLLTTNKLTNKSNSKLTRELLINRCHPMQNNKGPHTRAV